MSDTMAHTQRYFEVKTVNSTYYVIRDIITTGSERNYNLKTTTETRLWRTDGFFIVATEPELKVGTRVYGTHSGTDRATTSPITSVKRITETKLDDALQSHGVW